MTASRSKDNPDDAPRPRSAEHDKLTSEDLFGDIIDAPMGEDGFEPHARERADPIRVQITEPGAIKVDKPAPRPRSGPNEMREAEAEEVAALLDVFDIPEPTRVSPTPIPVSPPPVPSPKPAMLAPTPPPARFVEPPKPAVPAPAKPAPVVSAPVPKSVPPVVGAPAPKPPPVPVPKPAAAPSKAVPAAPIRPLRESTEKTPAGSSVTAPDLEGLDDELMHPASRVSTKFAAQAPKNKPLDGPPLDLAAVAEGALGARLEYSGPLPVAGRAPAVSETVYGPYRLLDRIAVGGMAEVFRVKMSGVEGFEKIVAVKRILPHLSDNKEFIDMFINEAKMVAGLTHPNIVQIFDLGKIEKTYFIAMEYVHGRDLRTIVKRAKERGIRIPLDLVVLIVGKVCAALEYAHRKKDNRGRALQIVHRDVSPQNILISYEGDVKLTDFGIAKAAARATHTDRGALRGKLLYMSPEQANGKSMDCRSDVFSMGIVFYEMITDRRPFMATSEKSILDMVRECQVPSPASLNARVPPRLDKVVMKALARLPEDRYQDASDMARDLERFLHELNAPSPTAVELARFMEILFDEDERGTMITDEPTGSGEHRVLPRDSSLEMEFEAEDEGDTNEPSMPVEPMSVQKLLKRFGLK